MPDNRQLWDRRQDRAERHPFLSLLYWGGGVTIVVLLIVALVGLASTGSVFFRSGASEATLKSRENIQRNSTGNAVASISFFHDQCNAVVRQLAVYRTNQLRADRTLRRAMAETDPIRRQQLSDLAEHAQTDADGALNAAQAAAADYDARAANSLSAKFREEGLPERISIPASPESYNINCG